jgi:hypothetical protein
MVCSLLACFPRLFVLDAHSGTTSHPGICSPSVSHVVPPGQPAFRGPASYPGSRIGGMPLRPRGLPSAQPCPPPIRKCGYPPQKPRFRAPVPPCERGLAPVQLRDPGPVKPLIGHAVGLLGATLALPFRLLETLVPNPELKSCGPKPPPCRVLPPRGYRPAPYCPPNPGLAKCKYPVMPPNRPMCMPGQAPLNPPMCAPPRTCAPVGPSVAPFPRASCGRPAFGLPYIPPAISKEAASFPPVEPQSLLGGIVNFPSRLRERGRVIGDMNAQPDSKCRPY